MSRYDILHRIEQLDPIKDHVEIYRLLVCYEFPWDYIRSLEVALYRTYCVPSISVLLDKTGELLSYDSFRRVRNLSSTLKRDTAPIREGILLRI
jgi:hypothetical protein